MANFEARTSSSGITLTPDQHRKLREYVDQFNFGMEDWNFYDEQPDSDGNYEWGIWGYDWLSVYPGGDDWHDAEPVTDQFLEGLKPHIPEGEELIIHCIGAEKLRFPLAAFAVRITRDKVEWKSIEFD